MKKILETWQTIYALLELFFGTLYEIIKEKSVLTLICIAAFLFIIFIPTYVSLILLGVIIVISSINSVIERSSNSFGSFILTIFMLFLIGLGHLVKKVTMIDAKLYEFLQISL